MFTTYERSRIRDALVSAARADPRIAGAAVTGSAALGREDLWSDIDLALCLAADADEQQVVADWTVRMIDEHEAIDHVDVMRGATRFRVFLLANTLQHAEYMISNVRDQVLALMCLRHGVSAVESRGTDQLPPEVIASLRGALVGSLAPDDLASAFRVVNAALIAEVEHVDATLAARLAGPVTELTG